MAKQPVADAPAAPSFSFLQYDRTVIAYHGTTRDLADRLVSGEPFAVSNRDDEWLGTGIYFWEHAPRQAWHWARNIRKYTNPAVVGAVIRLGNCFDLGEPENTNLLGVYKENLVRRLSEANKPIPQNHRRHMKLDCAVFNFVYDASDEEAR